MNKILIVCAGNICRSPLGEYYLKSIRPDLHVESAGIVGLSGYPADETAHQCGMDNGIDLSQHTARFLDQNIIASADIILAMDKEQVKILENKWPFSKGRVFRVGHWNDMDIEDPYKKSRLVFDSVYQKIIDGLNAWSSKI
jgi:protein-tyrosine phosphatase